MLLLLSTLLLFHQLHAKHFKSVSGLEPWVDVHTPKTAYETQSSRGDTWKLTFSDEFEVSGRDFRPGKDYAWTALELPDGVNAALEYYSFNMTSTRKDSSGRGVLQITTTTEPNITFKVYNAYAKPPGYRSYSMYYRSGMLQTWNKFCFQGGLLQVSAKLPGAVYPGSGNPDLNNDVNNRVKNIAYYPTWPGIWMMGNLGRALFTQSTNRMWPWSYDTCTEEIAMNQRINACDKSPGYGLNPNQGRGAPEIDLLEGGGTAVSTSIQLAPGMPVKFRMIEPDLNVDNSGCIYSQECKTIGANVPGVPSSAYTKRGYNSWYQNLKYSPNTNCNPDSTQRQSLSSVLQNRKQGITSNVCAGLNTCSASFDGYAFIGPKDNTSSYWGINEIGGCMPVLNAYQGAYLCDPDTTDKRCTDPRKEGNVETSDLPSFNYQMDAISANSEIPLKAYTDYINYQVEWVIGHRGYIRWIVDKVAIYEIPAESIEAPPQDATESNYKKLMIEEPMYLIVNVALSTSWGSRPPNPGSPCTGNGLDQTTNKVCQGFPMHLHIDHIRLYQDTSAGSKMAIGCNPATHPTKEWIDGHLSEYQDSINKVIEVSGGAACMTDDDCSVSPISTMKIKTGKCSNQMCKCLFPSSWGGPRCTLAINTSKRPGPSFQLSLVFGIAVIIIMVSVLYKISFLEVRSFKLLVSKRKDVIHHELELNGTEVIGAIEPVTKESAMAKAL